MKYLFIKTDQTEAVVGVCGAGKISQQISWQAGRELSNTLNSKIDEVVEKSEINLDDISGIIFYAGPGSFTGIRIGASVANALAYSLSIKIASTNVPDWIEKGAKILDDNSGLSLAKVEYGQAPNITKPRK